MIHNVTPAEFRDLIRNERDDFLRSIENFDLYLVKGYVPRAKVLEFRAFVQDMAAASEPTWHPCEDGVPDYHRINDEYPKSWVKARMHSFYFHGWNENRALFDDFQEIFALKNYLAGEPDDAYLDTIPSDGVIARVVSHHYPRGGGYLQEHVDPVNPFARIQTLVQASDYGEDFSSGGLYARPRPYADPIWVDPHTEMGDLMVLSPDMIHGVAPVDTDEELDWDMSHGRWMILPIIIHSDYNNDPALKPRGLPWGSLN